FFEKPLHDLELHRQFADLCLHPLQFALRRRTVAPLEPVRPALEEDPPPPLELVHRHLDLARDRPQLLALEQPHHDLALHARTPPLGYLLARLLRRHHPRLLVLPVLPLTHPRSRLNARPRYSKPMSREIGCALPGPPA